MIMSKPRIGILAGDPAGVGPELIAKLRDTEGVAEAADILLIGDPHVFVAGQNVASLDLPLVPLDARNGWVGRAGALHALDTIVPEAVRMAEVTEAGGYSVLRALDEALLLAQEDVIDAIVFGPFNKASMHLAGIGQNDELHYMAERLGVTGYVSELNTLDGIWTSRVTSHVALRDVADNITSERVAAATHLIHRTLRRAGIARPRIGIAALNPHAGDGGNFGSEEIDLLIPVIEDLAREQMSVNGPWPSDTVFLKAVRREIDAVVTMYHDQGQIALKLLGFERGVTVQGGLPVPVSTPAHGTAFDIAGQGKADPGATRAAFDIACAMVKHWDVDHNTAV